MADDDPRVMKVKKKKTEKPVTSLLFYISFYRKLLSPISKTNMKKVQLNPRKTDRSAKQNHPEESTIEPH